ncbi:hypothetical protein SKAU_G00400380 [Synaphobranchus kaupii]|uniref:Uncharacterized protein n=1 Tax=Synaphobranchus kaupii TaxID=118154 RepID=A0A9Q1E8W8_SYNKA|nr:hypothetical protein SKAU_G00400380 [Synaphobranchus kaupii]
MVAFKLCLDSQKSERCTEARPSVHRDCRKARTVKELGGGEVSTTSDHHPSGHLRPVYIGESSRAPAEVAWGWPLSVENKQVSEDLRDHTKAQANREGTVRTGPPNASEADRRDATGRVRSSRLASGTAPGKTRAALARVTQWQAAASAEQTPESQNAVVPLSTNAEGGGKNPGVPGDPQIAWAGDLPRAPPGPCSRRLNASPRRPQPSQHGAITALFPLEPGGRALHRCERRERYTAWDRPEQEKRPHVSPTSHALVSEPEDWIEFTSREKSLLHGPPPSPHLSTAAQHRSFVSIRLLLADFYLYRVACDPYSASFLVSQQPAAENSLTERVSEGEEITPTRHEPGGREPWRPPTPLLSLRHMHVLHTPPTLQGILSAEKNDMPRRAVHIIKHPYVLRPPDISKVVSASTSGVSPVFSRTTI